MHVLLIPEEILVFELSSFQLETLQSRCLDLGLITNISPDHLDRYPSFEAYRKIKYRLKDLVKSGGTFLFPEGVATQECAFQICEKWGVSRGDFDEAYKSFQHPFHRMEWVDTIGGVQYINDSKGTNIESVVYGVGQVQSPILLIAGGQHKGGTFEKWKDLFQNKVKKIFTIGEAAEQIEHDLEGAIPTFRCENLHEGCCKSPKTC